MPRQSSQVSTMVSLMSRRSRSSGLMLRAAAATELLPVDSLPDSGKAASLQTGNSQQTPESDPGIAAHSAAHADLVNRISVLWTRGYSDHCVAENLLQHFHYCLRPIDVQQAHEHVMQEYEAWISRPLNCHYPVVWIETSSYSVGTGKQRKEMMAACIIAATSEGKKECLALHLAESSDSGFWLNVLGSIKHRGVRDILIMSAVRLKGLRSALSQVYPETMLVPNLLQYLACTIRLAMCKHRPGLIAELKAVFKTGNYLQAETALSEFSNRWIDRYPAAVRWWTSLLPDLVEYFDLDRDIRLSLVTNHAAEKLQQHIRRCTAGKTCFDGEDRLLRLLFLGVTAASEKWTRSSLNWQLALSQMMERFPGRLDADQAFGIRGT